MVKIVLHSPEIPGNTGSIGRTCLALNFELILIRPYGFEISEKSVRRAGLDYWKHVSLKEYDSFSEFLQKENPLKENLFFFSKGGTNLYFDAQFKEDSYLIFGSETKGLPQEIIMENKNRTYRLPLFNNKVRSLNLSCVVTAVSYEAVRQIGPFKGPI